MMFSQFNDNDRIGEDLRLNFINSPRVLYVEGCSYRCGYCRFGCSQPFIKFNPAAFDLACRKLLALGVSHRSPVIACCDSEAYQPIGNLERITRMVFEKLRSLGLPFVILTKSGMIAQRDFDVLQGDGGVFGQSMVFVEDESRQIWEPNAAPLSSRVAALEAAKKMGITTYISMMPVIEPLEALEVIRRYHSLVDHWDIVLLCRTAAGGRGSESHSVGVNSINGRLSCSKNFRLKVSSSMSPNSTCDIC